MFAQKVQKKAPHLFVKMNTFLLWFISLRLIIPFVQGRQEPDLQKNKIAFYSSTCVVLNYLLISTLFILICGGCKGYNVFTCVYTVTYKGCEWRSPCKKKKRYFQHHEDSQLITRWSSFFFFFEGTKQSVSSLTVLMVQVYFACIWFPMWKGYFELKYFMTVKCFLLLLVFRWGNALPSGILTTLLSICMICKWLKEYLFFSLWQMTVIDLLFLLHKAIMFWERRKSWCVYSQRRSKSRDFSVQERYCSDR